MTITPLPGLDGTDAGAWTESGPPNIQGYDRERARWRAAPRKTHAGVRGSDATGNLCRTIVPNGARGRSETAARLHRP